MDNAFAHPPFGVVSCLVGTTGSAFEYFEQKAQAILAAKKRYFSGKYENVYVWKNEPDTMRGFSLVSHLSKTLARDIADYMVDIGTWYSTNGSSRFSFDHINSMFCTNLPEDRTMLGEIEDAIWNYHIQKVCGLDLSEDFDFMFYLDECPNSTEEEDW